MCSLVVLQLPAEKKHVKIFQVSKLKVTKRGFIFNSARQGSFWETRAFSEVHVMKLLGAC